MQLRVLLDRLKGKLQARPPSEGNEGAAPAAAPATASKQGNGKRTPRRQDIPDDYENNIHIKKYLDSHPRATIREVAKEVGLSTGKVHKFDAWKRAMAERKAAKPPPKKSAIQLTDKILVARGKMNDPAAKFMQDEAIWQWLLEAAKGKERAVLHMKNRPGESEAD